MSPSILRTVFVVAVAIVSTSLIDDFSLADSREDAQEVWDPPTTTAVPTTTVPTTTVSTTAARTAPSITYTYSVRSKGSPKSDADVFAAHVQETLNDERGWSLGGSVAFRQLNAGGDFTVWLAEPAHVPTFSSECDPALSCRVGRDVIINDARWEAGSDRLAMDVNSYRHMVVNHEVGHWLGLQHAGCTEPGGPANVMQQQSKGVLMGCQPNAWPLASEVAQVAGARQLGS